MTPIVIDARDATAAELRGWGRYTRELVSALWAQDGLGLDLVALAGGGRGPELLFEQVGLPRILRRRCAALVHAPNCFLPLRRPCPGVVTIHDLAFETWPGDFAAVTAAKFRLITPLAARSAQRIICPSQFTADDVCRRYRVDPGKVRVIAQAPALARAGPAEPSAVGPSAVGPSAVGPSAVGPSAVGPSAVGPAAVRQSGEPYVLAVGDLRAKKNLAALVRAFVAMRRRGARQRLVLAGADAGEGPRLCELAAGEPVQLTGYVSDGQLDSLLTGAELLVHPSLYEGFGLVVLEAMARGTPVLAARATALPQTGGDAAEYFDPDDPADLPRRLEALLADEPRRAELARRGLARAAQFSWRQTARATAEVYRELL